MVAYEQITDRRPHRPLGTEEIDENDYHVSSYNVAMTMISLYIKFLIILKYCVENMTKALLIYLLIF